MANNLSFGRLKLPIPFDRYAVERIILLFKNKVRVDIETIGGVLYKDVTIEDVETQAEQMEEVEHDSHSASEKRIHLEHTEATYIWFSLVRQEEDGDGEIVPMKVRIEKVPLRHIHNIYLKDSKGMF